jgi:hypothetical protein
MSWVEVRLAEFDSPERARSLFTVRAAISFARLLLSPRLLALASMCLYCRSRLGLDPRGIPDTSLAAQRVLLRTHLRERRYPPRRVPCVAVLPGGSAGLGDAGRATPGMLRPEATVMACGGRSRVAAS